MTVREDVVVAPAVRKHLGTALKQVLDSLWVIDCQTCNRPLTGQRPALSVDDMITFFSASLHHDKCRPSTWNDNESIPMVKTATLSHRTVCALIPVAFSDTGEEIKPFIVINPGLEMTYLQRSPLGQWTIEPNNAFVAAGFAPPPFTTTPVAGAVATLRGDQLDIIFKSGMLGPYDVTLSGQARDLVEAEGGAIVVITHAIDPHELTDPAQLTPLMRGDRTVMGYTQLDRLYRRAG